MSYSVELRECAVGYVRGGGGLAEAARLFWVSRTTLYRWLGAPDLRPKPGHVHRPDDLSDTATVSLPEMAA